MAFRPFVRVRRSCPFRAPLGGAQAGEGAVGRARRRGVGFLLLLLSTSVPLVAQQPGPPADTIPPAGPTGPPVLGVPAGGVGADTIPPPPPGGATDALRVPGEAVGDTVRPPLSASADSVLQRLLSLPGFVVTEYSAETASYHADTGILRLEGGAEVSRVAERVSADTIEYRERQDLVIATGRARVVTPTQELESESLHYDLVRSRALALGARTQLTEGATWYVTGDVTVEGSNRLFGSHARFTSCDLAIPHYHFEADQVMVIRDRVLVARPARLYFGNVPVMVLPFVVQSLEQGRRSGFLTPRFGVHDILRTSSGYNRQISDVGFYWAINEYMDAQLSGTWRSGAYTALLGNWGFNWRRQFLTGNAGLERYWREDGRREISLNTRGSWQPDERTSLSLAGRYASSSDFVREATYDPREATQDLNSSFSLSRRFDWGRASLGADRRQSIATGDVGMTLPSISLMPNTITLFRASPEQERWYSNTSLTIGTLMASRSTSRFADNVRVRRQDQDITRFRAGPSFSIGNLSLSASGELNRSALREAVGQPRDGGEVVRLPAYDRDEASWSATASYRQPLIGTTNLAPNIALSQQLVRDTLTGGTLIGAPTRLTFGAGLRTDLYGLFGGIGGYASIRHRFSPGLSYSYAPEVQQTELQERLFGRAGGRAQNRISFDVGQTFEAKLRTPRPPEPPTVPSDTLTGDTIPRARFASIPGDPEKVTILSLTTSPLEYDFIKAREEGNGFVTDRVSNTITSDYLRGLNVYVQHDLFDRSELDPALPENIGRLGRFAPRLSSLNTSFELGPHSSIFQWVERIGLRRQARPGQREGVLAGDTPTDEPSVAGEGAFTGNPRGTGGGPWRVSVGYQFSRPPRLFNPFGAVPDEAVQTLDGTMDFQLTPNWSVNWATSYSITDNRFGAHRLNFRRDLHEWQANFSFYQTPNGNSAFEFYVELLHNRDLRFDYSERNLGIDRRR